MDFFDVLFPLNGFSGWNDETFSAVYICLLFGVFLWFLVSIYRFNARVSRSLPDSNKPLKKKELGSNKFLKEAWDDYSRTFETYGDVKKTEEDAENYFNNQNILRTSANLNLLSSGASIFVGLGILGTFMGLTMGISSFDTSSTETIKNSITILLAGMGTAFSTSIWGMLLSVTYTFIEKYASNRLTGKFHLLSYKLDREFKATNRDLVFYETEKQKSMFLEVFGYENDEGKKVRPGNILRDLYQESSQQTAALKEFSSDLAFKIETGFEELLNDQKTNIAPLLEVLGQKIDDLATKLNNPAKEMTEGVIGDLKSAIQQMVQELKSSVSDSTKTEMEGIANGLKDASRMLESIPNLVKELNEGIRGDLNTISKSALETSETISRTSQEAEKEWQKKQNELLELFQGTIAETQEETRKSVSNLTDGASNAIKVLMDKQAESVQKLENSISGLQNNQKDLIQGTDRSIEQAGKTAERLTDLIANFGDASVDLTNTLVGLKEIYSSINETSSNFRDVANLSKESTNELAKAHKRFTQGLVEAESSYQASVENIFNAIEETRLLSDKYVKDFDSIESALSQIFEKIQQGLIGYEKNVRESTRNFLDEYSNALTNSTNAISSTVKAQDESLEDLKELFESFIQGLESKRKRLS